MDKGSSSPPQQPDPVATANAQAQANVTAAEQTAQLNRINQVTPYGNSTYYAPGQYQPASGGLNPTIGGPAQGGGIGSSNATIFQRGGVAVDAQGNELNSDAYNTAFGRGKHADAIAALPEFGSAAAGGAFSLGGGASGSTVTAGDQPWTQVQTLPAAEQANLESQRTLTSSLLGLGQGQVGRINDAISKPFDASGLPAAPVVDTAARQAAEDALYSRYTSRLDPEFAQTEAGNYARLKSNGIPIGSEAYNNEMDRFGRTKNDAYDQARAAAVAGGTSAEAQQFSMATQARQQALQEQLSFRNQPINELSALLGTSPGVNMPQFSAPGSVNVASPDIQGAAAQNYAGQLAAYNTQQNSANAGLGAISGLAGNALGAYLLS